MERTFVVDLRSDRTFAWYKCPLIDRLYVSKTCRMYLLDLPPALNSAKKIYSGIKQLKEQFSQHVNKVLLVLTA